MKTDSVPIIESVVVGCVSPTPLLGLEFTLNSGKHWVKFYYFLKSKHSSESDVFEL